MLEDIVKLIVGTFLVGVGIVGLFLWEGYVLSIIWGWYAVPVLGVPPLSIPAAIGIGLVYSCLKSPSPSCAKDPDASEWRPIFVMFGGPALCLLTAWIVKFWM